MPSFRSKTFKFEVINKFQITTQLRRGAKAWKVTQRRNYVQKRKLRDTKHKNQLGHRAQGKNLCQAGNQFISFIVRLFPMGLLRAVCVSQRIPPCGKGWWRCHAPPHRHRTHSNTHTHPSIHSIRPRLFFLPLIACEHHSLVSRSRARPPRQFFRDLRPVFSQSANHVALTPSRRWFTFSAAHCWCTRIFAGFSVRDTQTGESERVVCFCSFCFWWVFLVEIVCVGVFIFCPHDRLCWFLLNWSGFACDEGAFLGSHLFVCSRFLAIRRLRVLYLVENAKYWNI